MDIQNKKKNNNNKMLYCILETNVQHAAFVNTDCAGTQVYICRWENLESTSVYEVLEDKAKVVSMTKLAWHVYDTEKLQYNEKVF